MSDRRRPVRRLRVLFAAMLLAALVPTVPALAPTAAGALPSTPTATGVSFGIAGEVYAMVRVGDVVYLGGRFDLVQGELRHNLAAVDLESGALTDWNPTPAGDEYGVRALAASPTGSTIYVGGDFTSLDGKPRARVAAVSAAGAVTDWNPGVDDVVLALAVDPSGSPVYLGGVFSTVGGEQRAQLGAVSAAGAVTSWDPGAPGAVYALVVDPTGATVYVGGSFSMVGGQARENVGAVSATSGVATGWNVPASQRVASLALAPSGDTLYLGGQFSALGAEWRIGIGAATTAGTGAVTAWSPGIASSRDDPEVFALAVDPSASLVYVGGRFDTLGGAARTNLGAVTTSGAGTTTAWAPEPTPGWRGRGPGFVFAMSVGDAGASLLAAGSFEAVRGAPRDSFAQISTSGAGDATGVDIPVDYTASVEALARHGSLVYVGGNFTRAGAEPRRDVAAVDLTTQEVTPWAPRVTLDEPVPPMLQPSVSAIAVSPTGARVYLGGRFDHVNGTARTNLAAVSTTGTGPVVGWHLAAPDTTDSGGGVSALAVEPSGSRLYVGGGFSTVGGEPRAGLAAVTTGGAGVVTAWDPGLADTSVPEVNALALDPAGTRVFVGGSFSAIGGIPRENLAAVSTTGTGAPTGWAPDAAGRVRALVLDAGNRVLYAGGDFFGLGSKSRRGLGAVSTTGTGTATAWDPNAAGAAGDDVLAVALSADRSELFAGGITSGVAHLTSFSTAGAGATSAWSPAVDRPVVALAPTEDGSLLAGSTFNDTGRTDQPALAHFVPSSPLQLPVVSVGDGSLVEGAGGEQHLRLTVSLSRPATAPVSVYARTTTGSATAGTDYLPSAGWITIPAGATSAPVTITMRGDTDVEATEFVRVQLSDPAAARLGRATGIASVLDGDPSPGRRVSAGNAAVTEGDVGARTARFEVSLSRTYAKPVTVRYATAAGTAAGGSDFTRAQGTAVIPAGAHSVTVRVAVAGDPVAESTETFSVRLSAPTNAVLGRTTGAGRILDDDA
jgi:hypothetical protein